MTEIIKGRLKLQAMQKKFEALKSELSLAEHEYNEEFEKQLDSQCVHNDNNSEDGMFLSNEQLHKLLGYLEHTIVSDENISGKSVKKLIDFSHELAWDIADKFGYELNDGTIDPTDYKFREY